MLTRKSIIENPTQTPGEIIVVFENDGVLQNVLITDVELAASLAATPPTLPNPARPAVEDAVFAAAELIAAQ